MRTVDNLAAASRVDSFGEEQRSQMYCEITVEHQKPINRNGLTWAIKHSFSNELPLEQAYAMSAIYRLRPPFASLFAFDLAGNCFVILRKVSNVRFSMYHLEGTDSTVTVDTMLQAVEEFSEQLLTELSRKTAIGSDYRARTLTAKLFEDNGKETGLEGRLISLGSVFREKFAWKEIAPAVITFVTALLLISRRLSQEPVRAAVYSFLIIVVFALADMVAEYCWGRGKMTWRLRKN